MKITAIEIDGFGVWSELRLAGLDEGLNVFHGPNEAGKTTLVQFIRSMLYGFAQQRRQRYLPPVRGVRAGGTLVLKSRWGDWCLSRHDEGDAAGTTSARLLLTTTTGQPLPPGRVDELLCHVDEPTFTNVFAVGLREMQELATLADTAAASLLYRITSGLDRVSLAEVMHELDASRQRLLSADGQNCQVATLVAQRDRLRGEIHDLGALTHRYADLAAEQCRSEAELNDVDGRMRQLDEEIHFVETAQRAAVVWQARSATEERLAALGTVEALPERGLERLEHHGRRIAQLRRQRKKLRRRRAALLSKVRGLRKSQIVWRDAARIEAFADQHEWVTNLERQLKALDADVEKLAAELAAERHRLGVGDADAETAAKSAAPRHLRALRPLGRQLIERRAAWRRASANLTQPGDEATKLDQQIAAALADRPGQTLAGALEQAGSLVAQLRRRVQLDDRLEQMRRQQGDLSEDNNTAVGQVILPPWLLGGLGAGFALGVALVLAGLLLPTTIVGDIGMVFAILGLGGIAAAVGGKVLIERNQERQLERCQGELRTLGTQLKQAQDERDELDKVLPRGGGPLLTRLQAAEKELAALEALAPLDARRANLRKDHESQQTTLADAKREHRQALVRWRSALAEAGLPVDLHPRALRQLMTSTKRLSVLERRHRAQESERNQRREALAQLRERVAPLLLATRDPRHATLDHAALGEQLRELRQVLSDERERAARRDRLRLRTRRFAHHERQLTRKIAQIRQRRHRLLRLAGVSTVEALHQRAGRFAEVRSLADQRAALAADLKALIGHRHDEAALVTLLTTHDATQMQQRLDDLQLRHASCEEQRHAMHERRGQRAEQIKLLVNDRRPGEKQLELATVERRLAETHERWQVLATARWFLESIRRLYERERQPETLRGASEYLRRLTEGRYVRVWTPLSEEVLRIDDAEGRTLAVEVLSRGTREQLFLALRLALADSYARRGIDLPLVLDDLLVNFDADRARAAATVLRDFASAGHQVLVFTCHDHIQRLFRSLKVPTHRLPNNTQRAAETLSHARPVEDDDTGDRRQAAVAVPTAPPTPRIVERPRPEPKLVARPKLAARAPIVIEPTIPVVRELVPPPRPVPAKVERPDALRTWYSFWNDSGAEEFAGEFAERFAQFAGSDAADPAIGLGDATSRFFVGNENGLGIVGSSDDDAEAA